MEDSVKLVHAKNLNKYNFNLTLNIPIDNNVNIKSVLDINTYVFDNKVECGNGKAIISGKVGVKVLYLDTDNMTNILNETTNFSETYLDNSLTSDTYLHINNPTITSNVLSTDNALKINCEISFKPVAYLNLGLNSNININDNYITRKQELMSNCIDQKVNTSFNYSVSLEPKYRLNKILCNNSCFAVEKVTPENGYCVVEGELITTLVYEASKNEETAIETIKDTAKVKYDVEIDGVTKESLLDLNFFIDKSMEDVSTEVEDNTEVVNIKNVIKVCGLVLKSVSVDIVDDLYSTTNEIELSKFKREFTKNATNYYVSENISNEISLLDSEPAIDEVISNLNQTAEITNHYIKNDFIFVEGIVSSNLIYIDENKELKNKSLEIPFIINTKISASALDCLNSNISIVDSKIKVKRGTNIEVEYSLFISLTLYEKETCEIVDNLVVGKALDFSKYDYQIFLAKPQETTWDLCKRIKVYPNELSKLNKGLPLVMEGGEKIIIKR